MVTQLCYTEYWFYDRRDASTWCDVDSSVSRRNKSRHVPNMGSQVVLFSEQQASEDAT
jgi:phage baseplate assembly protein gpV